MIEYKLDASLDIEMAKAFLGSSKAGIDFGQGVWGFHPELKGLTKSDHEKISNYVNSYYKQNLSDLEKIKRSYQEAWDKVSKEFKEESVKLFNGFEFPDGEYIGYISIFNCNPRFLHNKTFQVFYRTDSSIRVTSHELMHFIFYEYTRKRFLDITSELDTNSGLWWDVSEVFNNIILSSSDFKSILKSEGEKPYPDHVKFLDKAEHLFEETDGIDKFIEQLFGLLSEGKV